jgi:hypothetical protein
MLNYGMDYVGIQCVRVCVCMWESVCVQCLWGVFFVYKKKEHYQSGRRWSYYVCMLLSILMWGVSAGWLCSSAGIHHHRSTT